MIKISLIFLISFSLCLAARPKLRSDPIFRPVQLIELLKTQLTFLDNVAEGYVSDFVLNTGESDALNEFAQSLAEQTSNPINYINSYTKSNEHVLTFGFRLKGDTKIETILLKDASEVVEHMGGFLDFRVNDVKLNMVASEIRDSIKMGLCLASRDIVNYTPRNCSWTKAEGTVSASSESGFKFNSNLKSLRDFITLFTMYDSFLESKIKQMTSQGSIPLGYEPFSLKMSFKYLLVDLVSSKRRQLPLNVDPNMEHDELLEAIDYHFKTLVDDAWLEAFDLARRIDRYGFGLAVDVNGDINVVYSFGGKVKAPETPKKTLKDYYNMMNLYVTPKGNKLNFTFDPSVSTYDLQRRNNRLMADALNMDRLNNNLRPVSENDPELFKLATREAERMATDGKLSAPSFNGVTRKTILIVNKFVGKASVKDFVLADSQQDVGSIVCYDNFSNQQAKVYQLLENYGQVCNKVATDAWKKFESTGNGIAFSSNGDVYQVVAMADSL